MSSGISSATPSPDLENSSPDRDNKTPTPFDPITEHKPETVPNPDTFEAKQDQEAENKAAETEEEDSEDSDNSDSDCLFL